MASKNSSIKVNAIMNGLLQVAGVAFPLITFPYISRVLLPAGVGKVSFANSIISYFVMFSQLGMPTYGVRVCAQVRDDRKALSRVVQELLIINIVTTILSYIGFLICLELTPKLYSEKQLFMVMSVNILFNAIGVEWLYKAIEAYKYITIRSIIFKFVSLLCVFALIHSEDDYIIYGALSVLANVGSNILNIINIRKYIDLKPVGQYHFKGHIKAVLVFFAMSCATTIYINLDAAMLGFMTNDAAVGCYETAVKIRTVLLHLVTALGVVILPRASYYVQRGRINEFNKLTEKALKFVFLIGSAMTCYFILYARESIYFLAGKEFENSIIPMWLIMPTLLLVGITNITGTQVLVPLGKEKIVLISVACGAVLDAIINICLIPILGPSGAAIGTLFAELIVLLEQYHYSTLDVRNILHKLDYIDVFWAILAGTIISCCFKFLNLPLFFTLALSAASFFIPYYGVLLLRKNQLTWELTRDALLKIKSIC